MLILHHLDKVLDKDAGVNPIAFAGNKMRGVGLIAAYLEVVESNLFRSLNTILKACL